MNRLRIRHRTGFHYAGDVSASYNEARMLPASLEGQVVLFSHVAITPPAVQHHYSDYWGTRVSAFELLEPHRELALSAESLVEVRSRPHGVNDGLSWDQLPRVAQSAVALLEQTRHTKLAVPPEEVRERAIALAAGSTSPAAAARAISDLLHSEVEYMPGATTVHSTAAEAWAHRKGVCQDITHLALGALRSVGIPARYVSGYLHPKPDAEIGETIAGESHAWVEWFDGSWRGYDPTNAIEIGDRHVIVGRGRDYTDVPPLRGVYAGPSSALFVTVEITREA
ncbi:transglutaminase-like putative cysteine protease [Microcella alkaliphila]|uniref:Transglutaminase-like putative cysteine protease n=1 Tax=Microcella alkaliphila TaxID=279828 RepID=A0A4Q7TGW5_9MICO|nr:transglutaminase family protein [Microcella alkaliphila]RZT59513.1 transglutaminase-like putative cysteine protease [Microcella alkaliphila]